MPVSKREARQALRAKFGRAPIIEWLSREEAATWAGLSVSSFSRQVEPHVDCRKLGKRVLISVTSLRAFMGAPPLDMAEPDGEAAITLTIELTQADLKALASGRPAKARLHFD